MLAGRLLARGGAGVALVVLLLVLSAPAGAAIGLRNVSFGAGADQAAFDDCVGQFNKYGGLAKTILKQARDIPLTINPTAPGDTAGATQSSSRLVPKGKPVTISFYTGGGEYSDGAPKLNCPGLLHELRHAVDYFKGLTSDDYDAEGRARLNYEEAYASKAENWMLWKMGEKQRTTYIEKGEELDLDRWTRFGKGKRTSPKRPRRKHGLATGECEELEDSGEHFSYVEVAIEPWTDDDRVKIDPPGDELRDDTYKEPYSYCFRTGEFVTLTAIPGPGNEFDGWGQGGIGDPHCRGNPTDETCELEIEFEDGYLEHLMVAYFSEAEF